MGRAQLLSASAVLVPPTSSVRDVCQRRGRPRLLCGPAGRSCRAPLQRARRRASAACCLRGAGLPAPRPRRGRVQKSLCLVSPVRVRSDRLAQAETGSGAWRLAKRMQPAPGSDAVFPPASRGATSQEHSAPGARWAQRALLPQPAAEWSPTEWAAWNGATTQQQSYAPYNIYQGAPLPAWQHQPHP